MSKSAVTSVFEASRIVTKPFVRMHSTSAMQFTELVVTDPCYIRSYAEFEENVTGREAELAKITPAQRKFTLSTFVSLWAHPGLMHAFREKSSFEVVNHSTDEIFYSIGKNDALDKFELLGLHGSDSGMSCIIEKQVYEKFSEVRQKGLCACALFHAMLMLCDYSTERPQRRNWDLTGKSLR